MWLTTSRTVHSAQGVAFPSSSGVSVSTTRVVSSTTRCRSFDAHGSSPDRGAPVHPQFVADHGKRITNSVRACPIPRELQAQADSLPWFHSIDLGHGVRTKGLSIRARRSPTGSSPTSRDRSVLDIGAWDGYYSFLAERNGTSRASSRSTTTRGASTFRRRERYWNECRANGTLPDHNAGHDRLLATRAPRSARLRLRARRRSEATSKPWSRTSPPSTSTSLGSFDVVLYLGVLYHMKEPLTCLERAARGDASVAVIETAAIRIPSAGRQSLLAFHSGGDLNRDYGNWYVPNIEALEALVLAAGFSRVEIVQGPPPKPPGDRAARRSRERLGPRREEPARGVPRHRARVRLNQPADRRVRRCELPTPRCDRSHEVVDHRPARVPSHQQRRAPTRRSTDGSRRSIAAAGRPRSRPPPRATASSRYASIRTKRRPCRAHEQDRLRRPPALTGQQRRLHGPVAGRRAARLWEWSAPAPGMPRRRTPSRRAALAMSLLRKPAPDHERRGAVRGAS